MDQESHEGVLKKVLGGNALMADSFVDHPPDVTNMAWMGKIFFAKWSKRQQLAFIAVLIKCFHPNLRAHTLPSVFSLPQCLHLHTRVTEPSLPG